MIRVIASDLDGTLLNENHSISDRTADTIKRACEAGIRFIVVTGRAYKQTADVIDQKGICCDYICASGAEVRNSNKEIVKKIPLPKELAALLSNI